VQGILPPVRRPVPLGSRWASESLDTFFVGHGVRVVGSGTQALALAIKDSAVRSHSSRPEVILPAYGCPNLIAASVYAGVRPRLVDTAKGQWGYDLDQLAAALSKDTVAIVAVNLLGVGDQAERLREIATASAIPLIQDSAQHLPQDLPVSWRGEYIVFSFGRGKPLNLLRGGVLLYPAPRQSSIASITARSLSGSTEWLLSRRVAGLAFNVATHPWVYGLAGRLPAAGVGDTHYTPLAVICRASTGMIAQVESGLAGYRAAPGYDAGVWREACSAWSAQGVQLLSCASQPAADPLRLRLALLAPDAVQREALVTALNGKGLGASRMYGASLERIVGVPHDIACQGPFPNAADLAGRLFTLPTHLCVSSAAVGCARQIVCDVLAR